jgi:AhpD family alkylhydroperoxidase
MAGVRLVDAAQAPLLARPYYEGGDPGPIVAAMAHVPELLEPCLPFLGAVFGPTAVPMRSKELVVLRTSVQLGCRYCVETHSVIALEVGLTGDEVRALRDEVPLEGVFTEPAELALLAWVDEVAGGRGTVDPAARAALAPFFDDADVVELTLLTGVTLMLNRFCTALELPTPAGTLERLAKAGLS